jgi:Cu(I)/Ag(I) efflux system membrane protein CusA/SilA
MPVGGRDSRRSMSTFTLATAFRSVGESFLIMLSVPFAMCGGVFLQWILGYPMTTA